MKRFRVNPSIRILIGVICLLPAIGYGQIYVYIDENGNKHYSDKPQTNSQPYQPSVKIQSSGTQQLPQIQLPSQSPSKQAQKPSKSTKKKGSSSTTLAQKQKRCAELDRKIDKITDKLRKAHSNSEGNRWRKERKALSDQRFKECR